MRDFTLSLPFVGKVSSSRHKLSILMSAYTHALLKLNVPLSVHTSLRVTAAAFAHEVNELFEINGAYADKLTSEKSYDSLELTDVSSTSDGSLSPARSDSPSSSPRVVTRREVISFGDGMEERTAVRIVAEQLSSIPKSVMFLQNPTPIQIIGQLLMLTDHMKYVCLHETSLDLEISIEQAEGCASQYIKRHKIRVSDFFEGNNNNNSHGANRIEAEHEQISNGVAVSVSL